MRSQTSYLVVLMFMMGCLAVVRLNPVGLLVDFRQPANLVVAAALVGGAAFVALRRPASFLIGLGAAVLTVLAGVLALLSVRGCAMPGSPIIWVVVGVYIAFRLTLVRHNEQAQQSRPPANGSGEPK